MSLTITPDNFTNFGVSSIASGQFVGAMQPTDTQFTLKQGDGAKYPLITPFTLVLGPDTINPELVQVTNISGDTYTVLRAQEQTTAQEWSVGTTVQQTITAANMSNLWTTIESVYAAIPTYTVTIADSPVNSSVQIFPKQPSAGTARALQLGGIDAAGATHVGLTITSDGIAQGLAAIASVVNVGSEASPTILVQASPTGYTTLPTVQLVDDGTLIIRGLSLNTERDFFTITPGGTSAYTAYALGPLAIASNQVTDSTNLILSGVVSPPAAPTLALATGTALNVGSYHYAYTYVAADGGETLQGTSAAITTTTNNQNVTLSNIAAGPYGTTARNIYRTLVGGSTYYFVATLNDNTTTTYNDTASDTTIQANALAPTSPTFGSTLRIKNGATTTLTLAGDGTITSSGKLILSGTLSADGGLVTSDGTGTFSLTSLQIAMNDTSNTDSHIKNVAVHSPAATAPTSAPGVSLTSGTALGVGTYQYAVSYYKYHGLAAETTLSPSASITTTTNNQATQLTLPINPANAGGRRIYRTKVGGSTFYLVATINDNVTTTYTDTTPDTSLVTTAPTTNTFGGTILVNDYTGGHKITLYPDGRIITYGAVSFDNGALTSDGAGNLTAASFIGSATLINGHQVFVGPSQPTGTLNNYDIWIKTNF